MINMNNNFKEHRFDKCELCYGYGLWKIGDHSPMGPIDARDGMPTIPCPQCGANANPVKKK